MDIEDQQRELSVKTASKLFFPKSLGLRQKVCTLVCGGGTNKEPSLVDNVNAFKQNVLVHFDRQINKFYSNQKLYLKRRHCNSS